MPASGGTVFGRTEENLRSDRDRTSSDNIFYKRARDDALIAFAVISEDFEASDGGYTHRLLAGIDEEGADDWQWGTPIGMGGDPH